MEGLLEYEGLFGPGEEGILEYEGLFGPAEGHRRHVKASNGAMKRNMTLEA